MTTNVWLVDANNVIGARPDGWWNDRSGAALRFTQSVATWCRRHGDDVVLVFDAPLDESTRQLAGGNLRVEVGPAKRRDGADDRIVALASELIDADGSVAVTVVTSDLGLRRRLGELDGAERIHLLGAGAFRARLEASA